MNIIRKDGFYFLRDEPEANQPFAPQKWFEDQSCAQKYILGMAAERKQ